MSNEKKALTKEQRATLKPLFDKLESAYYEVEEAVAAVVPRDDSGDLLFCFSCPREVDGPECSSFLGTVTTFKALCERDFCRHPAMFHA
jgi:hypothetical protein